MLKSIKKAIPRSLRRTVRHSIDGVPAFLGRAYRGLFFGDTSQFGEASACRRLMRPDWPPYVVDVGAYDGKHLSNSYPFVQEGWAAVLIEPHPAVFARLTLRFHGNPKVHCIQKGCSNVRGTLPLFLEKGHALSGSYSATLSTEQNGFMSEVRSDQSLQVAVDTLTNILSDVQWPKDFSLLSVDAEGLDFEVLQGLDFARFRPRLIITEEYLWNVAKHEAKYALLRNNGYVLKVQVGCNTIWQADEFI